MDISLKNGSPIFRRMKAIILIFGLCLSINSQSIAQNIIEARLENWEHGNAQVGALDFISGEIQEFGSIDKEGNLRIELFPDFLQKMKEQMEKEQEKAPDGWKASLKTLSGSFSCFGGNLIYENGDTNLSSLPKQLFVFKGEKEILGMLMAATNEAIANYFFTYADENTGKGKYLEWTYLNEPASVMGTCNSTSFTQTENETFENISDYSLELKKGWNLIEYHITEIFEDSSGKIHPKTTKIQNIQNIPSEIKWYFSPEK